MTFSIRRRSRRALPLLILVVAVAAQGAVAAAEPSKPVVVAGNRPTLKQLPPPLQMPDGLRLEHVHPLTALPLAAVSVGPVPPLLHDAVLLRRTYAAHPDLPEAGRLQIEFERDMPLFVGVSLVYEVPVKEPWYVELMVLGEFVDDGWLPIGMQKIWNPQRRAEELYTVFFRECRAGEKFTIRTRKTFPPVLFTAPGPFPSLVEMEPSPDTSERLQKMFVGTKGRMLLKTRSYDDLERWAGGYLRSGATFPSGDYRCQFAAYGFFGWRRKEAHELYRPLIPSLEEWLAKYPQSSAARLFAAGFFIGYASSLKFARADLSEIDEAHRRALELLYEMEQADPSNPHVYEVYLKLANDQDWDEALTTEYFRRAIASKSWCPRAVGTYVGYFSRHLKGNAAVRAKAQEAVEQAVAATRDRYGDMMYAASLKGTDYFFAEAPFYHLGYDWPRLRDSFKELIERYPNSRQLQLIYCKTANAIGDRETARALFDKLGPYDPDDDDGWSSDVDYKIGQAWVADDYASGDQRALFDLGPHAGIGVQWNEKGPFFLNRKGGLYRLDLQTGERKILEQLISTVQIGFAADAAGDLFAAAGYEGRVAFAPAKDSYDAKDVTINQWPSVSTIAVSRDGKQAAAGIDGGKVYVFDLTEERPNDREDRAVTATDAGWVEFVAFTPDGRTIITYAKGNVRLWDAATLDMIRTMNVGTRGQLAALSPDGSMLAAETTKKVVQLWDVKTGESLGEIAGTVDSVGAMTFSPDGRRLAVAQGKWDSLAPKSIALLDVPNRTVVRTYPGHKGAVRGVAFSPDGRSLLSVSIDRSARLWDVPDAP